jgi:hemoglobin-like flavoprotein
MALNERQIALVQQTFKQVYPLAKHVAEIFYGKLFALDPSLRALFPDDMLAQQRKLMQMLAEIVNSLDQPGEVVPTVRALGRRHVGYGVAAEHYPTMGQALLWMLAKTLGDDFTLEVEGAWKAAFEFVAANAIAGMEDDKA